jgi:hypothetical protein
MSDEAVVEDDINPKTGKRKRKAKDPLFKNLLTEYLRRRQLDEEYMVTAGKQVGQLQLEIDTVVTAKIKDVPKEKLQPTPFWFFQLHNNVEFKSIKDPLTEKEYARIMGRAFIDYGDLPTEEDCDQMLSCIVSAAKPRALLARLEKKKSPFVPVEGHPGLYRQQGITFPVYLIVCNELPVVPMNYGLLVFSIGKKLKEYLEQWLFTWSSPII